MALIILEILIIFLLMRFIAKLTKENKELEKNIFSLKAKDKIENDKTSKGVCVFVVDPQGNNIGYIMVNEKLEVMDRLEKGYKVNGE
jgi:hypothetical protein